VHADCSFAEGLIGASVIARRTAPIVTQKL